MQEVVLVVAVTTVAYGIAICRDPMALWRDRIETECAQAVEEFHRVYAVEVSPDSAVVYPGWMRPRE